MSTEPRIIIPLDTAAALEAERVGPKAASLAALANAGLPTPGGFVLSADAYRLQLDASGCGRIARGYADADPTEQRRISIKVRLALYERPIIPGIREPLLAAWRDMRDASHRPGVARSSSLVEDKAGANFAGQFQSFLGINDEAEFLTAVRSCWAALWTTNVRRYMDNCALNPGDTAMAVIVQPLIEATASGGGLSETADGEMLVSATWGLGTSIAQGEVVPDRIILSRDGDVKSIDAGHKDHSDHCRHGEESRPQKVPEEMINEPCLTEDQAREIGGCLRIAEQMTGRPVEIEWAMDESGIVMLQSRPLHVAKAEVPDEIWRDKPGLRGHPAGVGWGLGRAVVIECECQLSRVAPGDVLVTKVAGPALSHILPRVSAVVSERGGSTSHLASLARERGIPAVLGVMDATRAIPDGAQVAVDGVAGVVRWVQ